MPRQVIKLPARQLRASGPTLQLSRRKVAAYARVSTDNEDQITSYEAQVRHYESYIKTRADWLFAGIYFTSIVAGFVVPLSMVITVFPCQRRAIT